MPVLAWITARSYLLLFSAVGAVAIDYGSYWFALVLRCVSLWRQAA
ncbi:MAG: hypothetical protein VKJ31_03185 [Synechococcus sp.]|nr:hypothetical protein [Synechococcus sp.]